MNLKTIFLGGNRLLFLSTARVSLRKYFIPGCVGRGLDLDLRIRPAAAPAAASGNPGYTDLASLGLRSKNKVFERPGLQQVKSFREKISNRVRRC